MKLKIIKFKFLTGRPVCMINKQTAEEMNIYVNERVSITKNKREVISVVDTTTDVIRLKEIAVSEEIVKLLKLRPGDLVDVNIAERPRSINLIKEKMKGKSLDKKEIREIIKNIANNSLTEVEVAFFVSAVYEKGMSSNEIKDLTEAMVETGNRLKFEGKVVDKHSIGGVAGNRTTPIVVSICASTGLKMPKTSSRAITSAAGTADAIETIARVDFSIKEIKNIIKKTNACFVWGGALGLAPVDDKIIKVEKIVNIDSTAQVIASILSKKISVDSDYILIDIPQGKSAKVSKNQAITLKRRFIQIGKRFNLKIKVVLTDGSEPIGNGIGPALEMKDVLKVLTRNEPPKDLEEKSLFLSAKILELSGKARKNKGLELATEILESGKAYKKFLEIIKAQEGDIKRLSKINARFSKNIKSRKGFKIRHLNNKLINSLARHAGCPEDKSAGVYIYKKKNETLKKGDILITVYSNSEEKLKHALKFFKDHQKKIIESY